MQDKLFSFHESTKDTAQKEIEEYEKQIAESASVVESQSMAVIAEEPEPANSSKLMPFAKITEVVIDSPAYQGGAQVGDLVTQYGSLNCFNHNELKAIPEVTKNSLNKPLSIEVKRGSNYVALTVTPQAWKGAGILGCRFVPYSN